MGSGVSTGRTSPSLRSKLGAVSFFSNPDRHNNYVQADEIPLHKLSKSEKEIIQKHFHKTMMNMMPNIFHETMINAINSSKSLMAMVCQQTIRLGKDLKTWPRLISICEAQLRFYDQIIFTQNLDPWAVGEAVFTMGAHHYTYSNHGFNPQFFEIWTNHIYYLASTVEFHDVHEKIFYLQAFSNLNDYITSTMMIAYRRLQTNIKKAEKIEIRHRANSMSRVPQRE